MPLLNYHQSRTRYILWIPVNNNQKTFADVICFSLRVTSYFFLEICCLCCYLFIYSVLYLLAMANSVPRILVWPKPVVLVSSRSFLQCFDTTGCTTCPQRFSSGTIDKWTKKTYGNWLTQVHLHTNQPPFYGHFTGQPVSASDHS